MKNERSQQGFSLIELLIVVAIIGIIAAIAIPNLLASRRAANEASAIASLRTIGSAQATYQTTYGNGVSYSSTGAALGAVGLIDSVVASGTKSGYVYAYTAPATSAGIPADFTVSASPVALGGVTATGVRGFFVDATGVIRASSTGTATATSAPLNN